MAPEELRKIAESTFVKLQECLGQAGIQSMGQLLMPNLFTQHTAQAPGINQES